ncbi:MAG: helix-hairpin-helix domain-containing protein, partial [Elusimicrobiota bacterium]
LSGERIDLIPHASDFSSFISNSIAPGKASSVRIVDESARQAEVIVPNDQLALTIGKDGQNIRLACKLTGWSLAVKSEAQKSEEVKQVQDVMIAGLQALEGIGPKTAEVLLKSGMHDVYKLAKLSPEDLTTLQGVGEKTAAKIIESAKKYVSENPRPQTAAPAAGQSAAGTAREGDGSRAAPAPAAEGGAGEEAGTAATPETDAGAAARDQRPAEQQG